MRDHALEHIPLKAVDFQILLVLLDGPLHGYGMGKAVESRTEGRIRLEPGNLYRYVRRLVDAGLAEPAERRAAPDSGDERRRYYRITPLGRRVLAADAARMRGLAEEAAARLEGSGVP